MRSRREVRVVWLDTRLPVRFGTMASRAADEAVLFEGEVPAGTVPPAAGFATAEGHAPGCACCIPRSGAEAALGALFRSRAVAAGAAFRGVLVVGGAAGEAAVRSALLAGVVAAARFRLAE